MKSLSSPYKLNNLSKKKLILLEKTTGQRLGDHTSQRVQKNEPLTVGKEGDPHAEMDCASEKRLKEEASSRGKWEPCVHATNRPKRGDTT